MVELLHLINTAYIYSIFYSFIQKKVDSIKFWVGN